MTTRLTPSSEEEAASREAAQSANGTSSGDAVVAADDGQAPEKEQKSQFDTDAPQLARAHLPKGKIALTRAAMIWEQVWPAVLPVAAPLYVIVLVGLFGFWRATPGWVHWGAIAISVIATGAAAAVFFPKVQSISRRDAIRRLEEDAGLQHGPLQLLDDAPANGDDENPLWRSAQAKAAEAAKAVRLRLPRSTVHQSDPWGLRYVAIGGLIVGLVAAGDDRGTRMFASFDPEMADGGASARTDFWIEPPAYTGKAPIYLMRAGDDLAGMREQVNAPQGSVAVAQINGAKRYALSHVTTEDVQTAEYNTIAGQDAARARVVIERSGALRLRIAGREGVWPIGVDPDLKPRVAFNETPSTTPDRRLSLNVRLSDDYGVVKAHLSLRLDENAPRPLDEPAFDDATANDVRELRIEELAGAAGERKVSVDLQSDPWAGLAVIGVLIVEDAAGQTGKSEEVAFVLPERRFFNPLAKSIIDQRRTLAVAPSSWRRAGRALDALTIAPEAFYDRPSEYLLIETALKQVVRERNTDYAETVAGFWPLALQLEDEALELARRQLEAAGDALREALERGASPEEISQLVAQLRAAMDQYLQALAQVAPPQETAESNGDQAIERDQLDDLLRSIEQFSKSGAQNAAQQALADLEAILNNLQLSASSRPGEGSRQGEGQGQRGQGQSGSGNGGMGEQGQSSAGRAGDLIGRQRDLSNRAYREGLSDNPMSFDPYGRGLQSAPRQPSRNGGEANSDSVGSNASNSSENGDPGSSDGSGAGSDPSRQNSGAGGDALAAEQRELLDELSALRQSLNDARAAAAAGGPEAQSGANGDRPGSAPSTDPGLNAAEAADRAFANAQSEMRDAEAALQSENFDAASAAMERAIDQMREGGQALAGERAREARRDGRDGEGGAPGSAAVDPLGRPVGGVGDGDGVDVPEISDQQRAREILLELRKRLSDGERTDDEIDYLERLLERF